MFIKWLCFQKVYWVNKTLTKDSCDVTYYVTVEVGRPLPSEIRFLSESAGSHGLQVSAKVSKLLLPVVLIYSGS